MLRPEHLQHRKVGPLSDREFRLWISMIAEADDEGRLVCDAGQLRVATWGYHPKVTTAQAEAAIQALARVGLITVYTIRKMRYAVFPSWADHQKPKYPTKSKLPPPPSLPQLSPPVVVVGVDVELGSVGDVDGLNRVGSIKKLDNQDDRSIVRPDNGHDPNPPTPVGEVLEDTVARLQDKFGEKTDP